MYTDTQQQEKHINGWNDDSNWVIQGHAQLSYRLQYAIRIPYIRVCDTHK